MPVPLYFWLKLQTRAAIGPEGSLAQLPSAVCVLLAASTAVLSTAVLEIPIEACLLRLKTNAGASFLQVAGDAMSSAAGRAALFRGIGPFLARHILFEAAEFVVYESLKERRTHRRALSGVLVADNAPLAVHEAAIIAAVSAAAATIVSHPLDVLRVSLSLHGGASELGIKKAIRLLIARDGAGAFVNGLLPRLGATVPGSVIFFTAFEYARPRVGAVSADGGGHGH